MTRGFGRLIYNTAFDDSFPKHVHYDPALCGCQNLSDLSKLHETQIAFSGCIFAEVLIFLSPSSDFVQCLMPLYRARLNACRSGLSFIAHRDEQKKELFAERLAARFVGQFPKLPQQSTSKYAVILSRDLEWLCKALSLSSGLLGGGGGGGDWRVWRLVPWRFGAKRTTRLRRCTTNPQTADASFQLLHQAHRRRHKNHARQHAQLFMHATSGRAARVVASLVQDRISILSTTF